MFNVGDKVVVTSTTVIGGIEVAGKCGVVTSVPKNVGAPYSVCYVQFDHLPMGPEEFYFDEVVLASALNRVGPMFNIGDTVRIKIDKCNKELRRHRGLPNSGVVSGYDISEDGDWRYWVAVDSPNLVQILLEESEVTKYNGQQTKRP